MLSPTARAFVPTTLESSNFIPAKDKLDESCNDKRLKCTSTTSNVLDNKIKTGVLKFKYQVRGLILGRHVTSWLIALRPSDFSVITTVGPIHNEWKATLSKSWSNVLVEDTSITNHLEVDLIFTDSKSFLDDRLEGIPTIIININKNRDAQFSHKMFGGVTDFATDVAFVNIPDKRFENEVHQPLASIINYKNYVSSAPIPKEALNVWNDLLPYNDPKQKVILPCGFGKTKEGARLLKPAEILQAWDVPRHLVPPGRLKGSIINCIIPSKILLGLFDHVVQLIEVSKDPIASKSLPPLDISPLDPRGLFLPELNTWLSRKWIDQLLITEHSKKADNAAIPTHLWDIRICKPLGIKHDDPRTRGSLLVLRKFILARLHRNVILSFVHYMEEQHDKLWCYWRRCQVHQFHYPWLFCSSLRDYILLTRKYNTA